MSMWPAARARSAEASRPSARWPAPRRSSASPRPRSPCPAGARCGSTRSAPSPTAMRSPRTSPASTARRWSASTSRAPRARATCVVAELVDTKIAELNAAIPTSSSPRSTTPSLYTQGNYNSTMHTLIEGAMLAVLVVFIFLRDLRATLMAAIALPLSILPDLLGDGGARLLAQSRHAARADAGDRHPGRRRHRRDREYRAAYAHGQIAPIAPRWRPPTRSASPSSRSPSPSSRCSSRSASWAASPGSISASSASRSRRRCCSRCWSRD